MKIRIVFTLFILVWIILLVRIYQISIKSNAYYEALAKQNIVKKEWIFPVRGEILDVNGKPLAINKIGFQILIDPHLSSKKMLPELKKAINNIKSRFPDINTTKLIRRYKRYDSPYRHEPIKMIKFLPYEKVLPHFTGLSRKPYITIKPTTKRYYPYADTTAHVIGYVGKANKKDMQKDAVVKLIKVAGKSGLEKKYNNFLEGKPGYKMIKVSAFNKCIETLEVVPPIENRSLKLHLDIDLQVYISKLFENKAGAVVVMRTDGAVISAGSYPSFNPNIFVGGISRTAWRELIGDLNHPFTNKFIHGLYPPGSIIKPGVVEAFFDSRRISSFAKFHCKGYTKIGEHKFRCWKDSGHGKMDAISAIRESCDVYFYKGSLIVGINKIASVLKKMGLGKKTGIDLPGEFIGIIPDKLWKSSKYGQPWYIGETLNSSIGQGYMLVTPMQVATHTALLATGKLPTPRIVNFLKDKVVPLEVKDVLTPIQKTLLTKVQKAMYEVCNHPRGTATKYIKGIKVKIAGKTGTAQVIGIPQEEKKRMKEHELAYYHRSHAWMTTYGPYKNPQYIVTVLVEHGGHGGAATGEIIKNIYNWLVDHKYIKANL